MELNEYQKKAMSTCMRNCHNLHYMLLGLTAEVGELMDKYAKAIRKEHIDQETLFSNVSNESNANYVDRLIATKKELGDILWFVAGIADVNGWSLEDIAKRNIEKLADRQKRNVIDGNGDNR